MKEAGRSCVLSSRWRDLWKLTTVLNFDALNFVGVTKREILEPARSKYVGWVDQVRNLHKRPCLDEFKVGFCLNSSASSSIDEWVRFSIQKGVRRLEIDLKYPYPDEHYTLSQECYACFTNPSNLSRVKRLTSLSLTTVKINGQLLQYLLLNCPLEQVFICHSDHLVNLEVVGPSLQLKHLDIIDCNFMDSLELSAAKLLTFKYFGKSLRLLRVGELPLLTDLYLGSHHQVTYALIPFSSNFSQLETLELFMRWKDNEEIPQLPKLKNLKRLKLILVLTSERGLLNLTKLIEAAPALHKFTIEMQI